MKTFLSNSTVVRAKLREMFAAATYGRRRVALVAYVGADAPTLLPDFRGVELYCWPQVGGTDPGALATLMTKTLGGKIFLAEKLHAKLYWVEGVGYLVTSANLTTNALGEGGLHEVGLFIDKTGDIDIDALISSLGSRPATRHELEDLQRKHDLFWSKHPERGKGRSLARSYLDWYEGSRLPSWKLGWWDISGDEEKSTAAVAEATFGVEDIEDFIDCNDGQLELGDWVLCFHLDDQGVASQFSWLLVQLLHKLTKSEAQDRGFSHQAVQATQLSGMNRPPFIVKQKTFGARFNRTIQSYGIKSLRTATDLRASPQLQKLLAKEPVP